MSGRDDRSAGASPHTIATTIATPPVNSSTRAVERDVPAESAPTARLQPRQPGQRPASRARSPTRGGHDRHHRRFDRQLTGDRAPARAERRAQRDFLLAIDRARQQQLADVDARDQQHDADRREQQQQRGPRRADDAFPCADSLRRAVRPACVFGSAAQQPLADDVEVRVGRREADAGLQPRDAEHHRAGRRAARAAPGNCAAGRNRSTPPMK